MCTSVSCPIGIGESMLFTGIVVAVVVTGLVSLGCSSRSCSLFAVSSADKELVELTGLSKSASCCVERRSGSHGRAVLRRQVQEIHLYCINQLIVELEGNSCSVW